LEAKVTRSKLPNPNAAKNIFLTRQCSMIGDHLIATSVTVDTRDGSSKTVYAYTDYRFDRSDPKEFLVSHYGIPEPLLDKTQVGWPLYIWLFIVAASAGVTGLVLSVVRRWLISADGQVRK
jgi:hypothetical protein